MPWPSGTNSRHMPSSRPPARSYGLLRPVRGGRVRTYAVVREAMLAARAAGVEADLDVMECAAAAALVLLAIAVRKRRVKCTGAPSPAE